MNEREIVTEWLRDNGKIVPLMNLPAAEANFLVKHGECVTTIDYSFYKIGDSWFRINIIK